jgi:hypothetical protein
MCPYGALAISGSYWLGWWVKYYGYVEQNPIKYIDPTGLVAIPAAPLIAEVCSTELARIAQLIALGYIVKQLDCDDDDCSVYVAMYLQSLLHNNQCSNIPTLIVVRWDFL